LQFSLDFSFFRGHGGTSVERSFFIKDISLKKQESFYLKKTLGRFVFDDKGTSSGRQAGN
jgi:hypothetical protein